MQMIINIIWWLLIPSLIKCDLYGAFLLQFFLFFPVNRLKNKDKVLEINFLSELPSANILFSAINLNN